MTTIADIQETLSANPAISQVGSTMNCGRINSMLQLDLEQDLGLTIEMVQGPIHSRDPDRPGKTQHMWLRIPSGQLEETSGEVIVDGALNQFTASNYDTTDDINAVLNPHGEPLPSLVITTAGSQEYQYYSKSQSIN